MTRYSEIAARLEAATPGEWKIINNSADGMDEMWCYWHVVGPFQIPGKEANADSIFVSHAPADVAYLLAEHARLRAALAAIAAAWEAIDRADTPEAVNAAYHAEHAVRLREALAVIEAIESGRMTHTRTAGDVARAALEETKS